MDVKTMGKKINFCRNNMNCDNNRRALFCADGLPLRFDDTYEFSMNGDRWVKLTLTGFSQHSSQPYRASNGTWYCYIRMVRKSIIRPYRTPCEAKHLLNKVLTSSRYEVIGIVTAIRTIGVDALEICVGATRLSSKDIMEHFVIADGSGDPLGITELRS
jgi:hypothetical protein